MPIKSNPPAKKPKLQLSAELEDTFCESCLPLSMGIATDYQPIILPYLPGEVGIWSYHDRVLVWLVPTLEPDVRKFYDSRGADMASLFKARQLDYIDEDLRALLVQRVNTIVANLRQRHGVKARDLQAYVFGEIRFKKNASLSRR